MKRKLYPFFSDFHVMISWRFHQANAKISVTYTLTIFGFSEKLSKDISVSFGLIFAYIFFRLLTKVVCNRLILRIYLTKPIPNSLNVHLNILGYDLHTRNFLCLSAKKCYNLLPRFFVLLDQRSGSTWPRKVLIGSPKRTELRSNCACLTDNYVVNRVAGAVFDSFLL